MRRFFKSHKESNFKMMRLMIRRELELEILSIFIDTPKKESFSDHIVIRFNQ